MKQLFFVFTFSLLIWNSSIAQQTTINWLSFEELAVHFEKEQKPILVFLHTDWCKYCKMQENTSFSDSSIIQILNQNYYTVRLNAESKDPLQFFGRSYEFDIESGYHQLATYLGSLEGKLEFPTTLILNKRLEPNFKKAALIGISEMTELLD